MQEAKSRVPLAFRQGGKAKAKIDPRTGKPMLDPKTGKPILEKASPSSSSSAGGAGAQGEEDEEYVRECGKVASPINQADFVLARGLFCSGLLARGLLARGLLRNGLLQLSLLMILQQLLQLQKHVECRNTPHLHASHLVGLYLFNLKASDLLCRT